MEYITKINYDLVDIKSLDYLFDNKVLTNRAKSIDTDFIDRYTDDYVYLYIYDLLALVIIYNMNRQKSYDDYCDSEISTIIAASDERIEKDSEEDEEYVLLPKMDYYNLIENIKKYPISSEFLDTLICLYIYNEAYIENDFQVHCYLNKLGTEKCDELLKKNIMIAEYKNEIKNIIKNNRKYYRR